MEDYVTCPGCKYDVVLPRYTVLGEIVRCPGCGHEIEILSLGPFIPNSTASSNWGERQRRLSEPLSSRRASRTGFTFGKAD